MQVHASFFFVFLTICLVGSVGSVANAQENFFNITINPGATDSASQNPISPKNVTTTTNTTVIWINNDSVYHQIISGTPDMGPSNIFYGDIFGPNESYNVTFDNPGIYDYYDPASPHIQGQITIENPSVNDITGFSEDSDTVEATNDTNIDNNVENGDINPNINTTQNPSFEQNNNVTTNQSTAQLDQVQILSDTPLSEGSSDLSDDQSIDQTQPGNEDQGSFTDPTESQNQLQPDQFQFNFPEHEDTDSFIATGIIDSLIVTSSDNWNTTGEWTLVVEDGEVTNFVTNMAWFNGITGHTHDFINLNPDDEIELPSDNILSIEGEMDVATNGIVSWEEVDSTINIGDQGRTITFLVDHDKTDDHFAGQPVNGIVTSLTPCSDTPGPNMVIYPPCN